MPLPAPSIRICYQHIGSPSHPVVQRAVEELVREQFGRIVSIADISAAAAQNEPLLAIDGDGNKPVFRALQDNGRLPDFHLVVTELGIEVDSAPCSEADVALLKDGIQAACTVTDGPTPAFNCPCCG